MRTLSLIWSAAKHKSVRFRSFVEAAENRVGGRLMLHGLPELLQIVMRVTGWADLTLIDPEVSWTVDPASFLSMGRCTPYEKMKLTGRAAHVIVGGRLCF